MFRDSFKYYKSRAPPPDLRDVIDLDNDHSFRVKHVAARSSDEFISNKELFGLKLPNEWMISEFVDIPGLIFVRNPFTPIGQRYWITKCLRDYSRKPHRLNIDPHNFLNERENWWDVCTKDEARGKELVAKLRWATLGYHHNWDTKHYSDDSKTEMPTELSEMTGILAKVLGFNDFKAEAAIVNYYRMNSTLAGHTDHSEIDREAPLFSISFGQSAIFLIGGLSQEEPASAIFLRSGDVVAMTGESRLRYHGIPKILPSDSSPPWDLNDKNDELSDLVDFEDWSKARTFIGKARINMNVRQVLRPGQLRL